MLSYIWDEKHTRKIKASTIKEYRVVGSGDNYMVYAVISPKDKAILFRGTELTCKGWVDNVTK